MRCIWYHIALDPRMDLDFRGPRGWSRSTRRDFILVQVKIGDCGQTLVKRFVEVQEITILPDKGLQVQERIV